MASVFSHNSVPMKIYVYESKVREISKHTVLAVCGQLPIVHNLWFHYRVSIGHICYIVSGNILEIEDDSKLIFMFCKLLFTNLSLYTRKSLLHQPKGLSSLASVFNSGLTDVENPYACHNVDRSILLKVFFPSL